MEANLYYQPANDGRLVLDINGRQFMCYDGVWHQVLDDLEFPTLKEALEHYGVLNEILEEQGKARPELVELFKDEFKGLDEAYEHLGKTGMFTSFTRARDWSDNEAVLRGLSEAAELRLRAAAYGRVWRDDREQR